MKSLKKIPLLILVWSLLLFSCEENKDVTPEPETIPSGVIKINEFIWDNMDFTYFWRTEMPRLDPKKQADSETFFEALLYTDIDQWSFITDDYQGLLDYFAGVQKSVGYSIRLYRISSNSNDLIGFIEYVNPDSPADKAGLKRTDMFFEIDGQRLTIENYSNLLGKDSFELTKGQLNSDMSITPLSPKVSLTAVELTINPILYYDILEHADKKIGYLVYNSFVDDYNEELESVFADFKAANIDDLILDLRYNSGGAVSSAILMASMIAPASSAGSVLLNTSYNSNLTSYFRQKYPDDPTLFQDKLTEHANNLDLSRLVVFTSYKTASASEMVIYGLDPYMEIIQIGEQTHGKYYGSITISDPEEKHNWAIQPIVMRAENATNSIDYAQGLIPDHEWDEGYIYQLGDPRERFLAKGLLELTGIMPAGSAQLKAAKTRYLAPGYVEESPADRLKYEMHRTLP
jgi:C-terminal processing protease CtpA/Prc